MDPPLSDYEQLRASKIARNEARLASLGLADGFKPMKRARPLQNTKQAPKKPKQASDEATLRRSSRVSAIPPSYNEQTAYNLLDAHDPSISKSTTTTTTTTDLPRKTIPQSQTAAAPAPLSSSSTGLKKVMAKDLAISPSKMVSSLLNRSVGVPGKLPVVNHLGTSSVTPHSEIGFSKYTGVLEFSNAIVLWVNYDANPNEKYVNSFLKDGAELTWYGGSRMTMSTEGGARTVNKLLKMSKLATSNILLFTRFMEGSKSEPYVCLGRLGYITHDPNSSPMKWVWKLQDFAELNTTNKGDTNLFREFVNF